MTYRPPRPPQLPQRPQPYKGAQDPVYEEPESPYLTVGDGFRFGVGFGIALTIALPVILAIISCFVAFVLLIFGSALGGLLAGGG